VRLVRTIPTLLIALLALTAAVLPGMAAAQSTPAATPPPDTGPRFVLRPAADVDGSYFTVEAEAGSTQTLKVVLGNADDEPLTLRTFAADAFTLVNGGFGVQEEDVEPVDTATWLDYEGETVMLEPGKGMERAFTLTVPADAAPGQYIAGIVLQTAEPIEIEGSAIFDQIIRKSIAVFITVPGGTTPAFELGTPEVQSSIAGQRLVVPVRNAGNVLLKPAGELTLTDGTGKEALRQQLAMGSVYAGMETTLEVPLPPALAEGDYDVTLDLTDAETAATASVATAPVTLSREVEKEDPLAITTTVTPMPAADDVQFAVVSLTIENRELPVNGAQVLLHVTTASPSRTSCSPMP
jgi:hypothetical protein